MEFCLAYVAASAHINIDFACLYRHDEHEPKLELCVRGEL